MDEKFMKRYESFKNSLASLSEARERDLSDSFVLSGMKDILVQYYAITSFVAGSPREVLRESFQAGLIHGDEWMMMLKVRNQLAHDYDGMIVKSYCRMIVDVYLNKFEEFQKRVEQLLSE